MMASLLSSAKHSTALGQLSGAALPLAVSERVRAEKNVYLIVTPNQSTALRLHHSLLFFLQDLNAIEVLFYPDWETLPYDRFSPYQDLISQRLSILNKLGHSKALVIVSAINTLMQRIAPPNFLTERVWLLKTGQKLHLDRLRHSLESAGYRVTAQVLEHGEYSIRGSIIDIFPMGSEVPYRIELFDDEVDSIRTFDTDTQRTIEKIAAIELFPAKEFPTEEAAIVQFRKHYRECFPGNSAQSPLYEAVSAGQFPGGIEYYLPLFFEKTASFFDHLPQASELILVNECQQEAEKFWKEIENRYQEYGHDIYRPLLPPADLFVEPLDWFEKTKPFRTQYFYEKAIEAGENLPIGVAPELPLNRQQAEPLQKLQEYLAAKKDWRVVFLVESAGRREVLLELLNRSGICPVSMESWSDFLQHTAPLSILIAPLDQGTELEKNKIALVVESQLFQNQSGIPQQRALQTKTFDPDVMIRDLIELQPNTPVVHIDHGVGRYLGLQTIDIQGVQQDFMVLLYAAGDKIYVPITALHLVTRYTGGQAEHAPLNKLGTDVWQREKKKAVEKIQDVAAELLEIYALRKTKSGIQFHIDQEEYARFKNEFAFTETPDQQKAIEDILKDLQKNTPMERLICGDVGFGKTEVAMRAAFVAIQNGKQVCVLVPTTLLAAQHFETFRDRFATFPIQIGLLSRFKSAKESAKVIDGLKQGTIDIVIGTHKLFSQQLIFKSLGLLIIDEEHRFGVKQKELIKTLKNEVHCLTMTATPIPRTLNMAMSGLRDISLIATPPAKRLAIKTFWREKNHSLVREAVLREILRGGQVFYLHNEVSSMERITEELKKLLPEASIRFAHGQMPERHLERLMTDFYHQQFNVLVCTTIIETGIDIPTANTILIERADLFGLAQLHQLRGRVGRSHHQAYAYLLTPAEKLMTPDAVKRLEAIVSLEELGSGFILATHDLEIRGAGELLGDDQSGNMHAIGFTLYMELLDRAVGDLKEGKQPSLLTMVSQETEIEVYFSTLLPEEYIADVHTRLILYKRIANCTTEEALESLQVELIDRFGLLPVSAKHLFRVTQLKVFAKELGIQKVQLAKGEGKILFQEKPKINSMALIGLIQGQSSEYRMQGPNCLKFRLPTDSIEKVFEATTQLLGQLQSDAYGTEGGNRTHMVSPPLDFESSASTNSATSAKSQEL